ncbi:MAG: S26 family signal peptidase, partial [Hyphomicrobiales bacterium]|nr:S26 family signal peptidase [Hyphomicrobiales bacterium]
MPIRSQSPTGAIAVLGLAFLATKPLIDPAPLLIWNASESVPIGWYLVARRPPKIGEIAVIKPAEWIQNYASTRGYFPQEVLLLKPVLASNPSIICRFGPYVFVDGKDVVKAAIVDKKHRPLPVWKGCKALKPSQYFVLGRHRDSFDSRYFGPIDRNQVIGTAFPLAD